VIFGHRHYLKNEYAGYLKMVKYSGFWPDACKAWEWLNNNTSGNNIAYVGRPVPFPLYGSRLKNNVYYVSVNETEPAKLHYFKNSRYSWGSNFRQMHLNFEEEYNYRGNADYSQWLKNLRARRIDYLFIYSLHQIDGIEFPIEEHWARQKNQVFRNVFSNDTVRIYRVNR
jgi:hypothetical protein